MDRSASGIARCIRLAREGQPEALNELLEAHRNYLRLLAASCLHREMQGKADPSDVVQETLLKVHENFRQFRGTTELEWMAWLRKILVNHLTDFQKGFRRERRSVTREQSLESLVDRSSAMLRNLGPGARPVAEPGGAAPRGGRARRGRDRRARARGPRRGHPAQPPRAGLERGRRADRAVARRGAHALGPGDAARGRIAQGEAVMTDRGNFAEILDEYLAGARSREPAGPGGAAREASRPRGGTPSGAPGHRLRPRRGAAPRPRGATRTPCREDCSATIACSASSAAAAWRSSTRRSRSRSGAASR